MAELQEELQAILGDPQAMGQITAIARALTGGSSSSDAAQAVPSQSGQERDVPFQSTQGGNSPSPPAPEEDYVPTAQGDQAVPDNERPAEGAPSGETGTIPDLSSLMGLLGSGGLPDLDPKVLSLVVRVYSEYSAQDDEKAALLSALRPFLREERAAKLEKAERVARLSRLVRVAIQLLKEGGHV